MTINTNTMRIFVINIHFHEKIRFFKSQINYMYYVLLYIKILKSQIKSKFDKQEYNKNQQSTLPNY